jgi:hypothetical protein
MIDRGIFIDTGTTVQFTGSGKFFVDNMFPRSSSRIRMTLR